VTDGRLDVRGSKEETIKHLQYPSSFVLVSACEDGGFDTKRRKMRAEILPLLSLSMNKTVTTEENLRVISFVFFHLICVD
jgi:hypothetical protein